MAVQDNKYLTLCLAEEIYAIPILKIREIIGMLPITPVPRVPKSLKGVLNLRGKIFPVIDLRLNFDLEEKEYDNETSIIIIEIDLPTGKKTNGIIVDSVQEVLTISPDKIDPPPKYGVGIDNSFLLGMGKVGEKVVMILNVDEILTKEEKQSIENI